MHDLEHDPVVDAFLDVTPLAPSARAAARLGAGLDALVARPARVARTRVPYGWIAALLACALLAVLSGGEQDCPRPVPRDPWLHRPAHSLSPIDLPTEALGDPRGSARGACE